MNKGTKTLLIIVCVIVGIALVLGAAVLILNALGRNQLTDDGLGMNAIDGAELLDEGRVRFRVMGEGPVYDDGVVRVTAFPTQHMAPAGRPAYSYLVQAEGKEALFSGDLSGELRGHDFPKYALEHEPDVLVCEMAHFSVDDAAPYLEKCRAKKVLFNHVFPLDKLDKIDALDGRWGYPIRTAADGETIVL